MSRNFSIDEPLICLGEWLPSQLFVARPTNRLFCFLFCRDGRGNEEGGVARRWTHCRGEKPALGGVQKRDRCQKSLLENNLQHRTEGGEQGRRGETRDDPSISVSGREGAQRHLRRHTRSFGQTSHPLRVHWRIQSFLLQNVIDLYLECNVWS